VRLLELGTVRSGRLCISISDTLKDYFYDYHREFKALLFLLLTGNLVHSEVVLVVYTHLPTIFLNLVSLLLVYFYLVRGSLFHGEAALFSCSWFSTGRYGFLNSGLPSIIHFFTFKWYFDHLYNFFLVNKIFKGSYTAFKYFDKGWLEALGPEGFASFFEKGGYNLSKLQSGYTDTYLFLMVVSSIPIVFTIVMWTFLV
jgi:NADH:ubiquinone oxidoreductase subunit 5 (subunit L)/multisubunit Na+/H+ antiporter MnhA subunit